LFRLARWHDGPLGPFPGGAMTGELVAVPVADWSAVLPANEDLSEVGDPEPGATANADALSTWYLRMDPRAP
jgi:hypothetical protein